MNTIKQIFLVIIFIITFFLKIFFNFITNLLLFLEVEIKKHSTIVKIIGEKLDNFNKNEILGSTSIQEPLLSDELIYEYITKIEESFEEIPKITEIQEFLDLSYRQARKIQLRMNEAKTKSEELKGFVVRKMGEAYSLSK